MKFRHAMTWLHTWAGLVLGALLYLMFVTGSAGYFDVEITRWMQPEIPLEKTDFDTRAMLPKAEQRLAQVAPDADKIYVEFPQGRYPYFMLWWHNPESVAESGWHQEVLNPNNGEPVTVRETAGGEFLYRLHYVLHYIPKGLAYWLTSLAAMFMLVAIITGVVIHRRIFKDFFTFRRTRRQTSWLDMHNLLGVLPLPFHLMITYSGLILLMFSTMLPIPASSFGLNPENLRQVYDAVFSEHGHVSASGATASSRPLLEFYDAARDSNPSAVIAYVAVDNLRDQKAIVEIGSLASSGLDAFEETAYWAVDGSLLSETGDHHPENTSLEFYEVMEKLHEGLFADSLLRWIYFLSGLMGAGMVATGAIFWANKRRHAHDKAGVDSRGLRLVEGLNVGVIVGLPSAIAAYFLANRLLSSTLVSRGEWEAHCLFVVWFVALIHPFVRRRNISLGTIWVEQFRCAAVLYALIPLMNAATSSSHLLMSLRYGDWVLAGFDLFMVAVALCFFYVAQVLSRREIKSVTKNCDAAEVAQ